MPSPGADEWPREVRRTVAAMLAVAAAFLLFIFVLLEGLDADFPPVWLVVVLLLVVVTGTVLAERAWLSVPAVPRDADEPERAVADALVAVTVRKFVFCEGAVLVCVAASFVAGHGGWLLLLVGVPGLLVMAFETWPSTRNLALIETMLDADGARSGLIESFETA